MMEVFAGFLEPHRPPHRAAARLPRGDRRARQHPDHGDLRQRRQRRGRPDGLDQRDAVLQQRCRRTSRTTSRSSTSSAARGTSTTTRGAGPGPATRRSGAGSARPTAAASATRSSCPGRPASRRRGEMRTPVRARHRHGARRCSTCSASSRRRRSAASRSHRSQGVSFAHTFDDADAPTQPPHPVLRDVRPPRDLPRRLARGVPVARPDLHRGGQEGPQVRRADLARDARRPRAQRLGALRHDGRCRRDPRRRRGQPGQAHRDGGQLVGRGRQVRRDADRRRCLSRLTVERPQIAKPRDSVTFYPDGAPVPFAAAP